MRPSPALGRARLIRFGDSGPAVRDLQRRLSRALKQGPRSSGCFDQATLEAVRRFQRDRGLPADGIVGPETWRVLIEAGFKLGDRLLWHSRNLMRGDDVLELQRRLNGLGFHAGPEDGILGVLTQSALEDFQRNIGLVVDGVCGAETVAMLARLHREHHSRGVGIRAREREALRTLSSRGLPGRRVLLDPSHGPDDPGHLSLGGLDEASLAWAITARLAGRLAAVGVEVSLSRGPNVTPSAQARARLANALGVDVVVSVGLNALDTPAARGAATYYYGTPHFTSETGRRLAEIIHEEVVADDWRPDCRTHPMTWAILRDTRMPAVVVEPAFLSSPEDEARLRDPARLDDLAGALASGVARFFTSAASAPAVLPLASPVGMAG